MVDKLNLFYIIEHRINNQYLQCIFIIHKLNISVKFCCAKFKELEDVPHSQKLHKAYYQYYYYCARDTSAPI